MTEGTAILWLLRALFARKMYMQTLKPCPFCGTPDPKLRQSEPSDERYGYNFTVYLECTCCGTRITRASVQDKGGWCIDEGEAMAETIKTWNSRV